MPRGEHHMQGQVPFARKDKSKWKPGTCVICDNLAPQDLIELNLLIADPKHWPRNTFEGLKLPSGVMRPRYRLWGAARVAEEWLKEHDYWPFARTTLRMHINRHVPWTAEDLSTPAVQAALAEADSKLALTPVGLNPVNFKRYYEAGIALGAKAIELLTEKVAEAQRNNVELPTDLLLKLADQGSKLAASAAALSVKGYELSHDKEEELEGFRSGSAPIPLRASKHHTITVIDGEARPVTDEGRGDRRDYNARAREEGGTELPA
jgi:hypothetical protein